MDLSSRIPDPRIPQIIEAIGIEKIDQYITEVRNILIDATPKANSYF